MTIPACLRLAFAWALVTAAIARADGLPLDVADFIGEWTMPEGTVVPFESLRRIRVSDVPPADGADESPRVEREIDWSDLSEESREALKSLESEWKGLSAEHRAHAARGAEAWSRMDPREQRHWWRREQRWRALSVERRESLRRRFEALSTLPPLERARMVQRAEVMRFGEANDPDSDPNAAESNRQRRKFSEQQRKAAGLPSLP